MTLRRLVLATSLGLALPASASPASGQAVAATTPVDAPDASIAQPLLEAYQARDAARIQALIDIEALFDRVFEGSTMPPAQQEAVRRGARSSMGNVASNIANTLRQGNVDARLMRLTPGAGGEVLALLRYELRDGEGAFAGFDYAELVLGPDGRMRDWYTYSAASHNSDVMRQMIALSLQRQGGGMLARVLGIERVDDALLAAFEAFVVRRRSGDMAGALAALDGMQGPIRDSRLWLVMRVQAAGGVDETAYLAALADLDRRFGDEPELQLLLLDRFFATGDYRSAIDVLARFERGVIEDEITNTVQCQAAIEGGLLDEAKPACARAIELAPGREDAWLLQLVVLGRQRDRDGLIAHLESYDQQFGPVIDLDALQSGPEFAWLREDRAFQRWARDRDAR